jgi:hypothetical protein
LLLLASAGAGILVHPYILLLEGLRLLLRLLIILISRTLATAGAPLLFFYGRHLGRTVPVILPVISSLVPVIGVIELPESTGIVVVSLSLPLILRIKGGLQWISQCITVGDLDCLGQHGRHIPLKLLPQHGAMPAPLSKPHDSLLLHNSFTEITQRAPPSEVVTVGLVFSLPAVS